jgi:hypothetical protein
MEKYTITDPSLIRKALCLPKSMPKLPLDKLVAFGTAMFAGDNMPAGWSVNDKFKKGESYPAYWVEDAYLILGLDGVLYKPTAKAWNKIVPF